MEILDPALLLSAYAQGVFPMAPHKRSRQVDWYEPEVRGIIPLTNFRVSKNVRRLARNGPYRLAVDTHFRAVLEGCARRRSTWISPLIINSYHALHKLGFAHSVEVFREDVLVGGLYGVTLGGAFFGESMFQTEPEAHKIALLECHSRLVQRGFVLWDTQYYTPHLGTFGAVEIPQTEYLAQLALALKLNVKFA